MLMKPPSGWYFQQVSIITQHPFHPSFLEMGDFIGRMYLNVCCGAQEGFGIQASPRKCTLSSVGIQTTGGRSEFGVSEQDTGHRKRNPSPAMCFLFILHIKNENTPQFSTTQNIAKSQLHADVP